MATSNLATANGHPQIGVALLVDPTDRCAVIAPGKGFQAAQPGQGLSPRQTRNRWRGMQGRGQVKDTMAASCGLNRRVQMHQLPVPGQARLMAAVGPQTLTLQRNEDFFHHQLVFVAILAGPQQQLAAVISKSGRSRQAVATETTCAQLQQPLRRSAHKGRFAVAASGLPQETAAARLLAAKGAKQLHRFQGAGQQQLLPCRQHQLAQFTVVDQLQSPADSCTEGPLPARATGHDRRQSRCCWRTGLQGHGLLPQRFGEGASGNGTTGAALMQQPAVASLAGQLPAGENNCNAGNAVTVRFVEEAEGQRQPWTLDRGEGMVGTDDAAEAVVEKALGQGKAARPT